MSTLHGRTRVGADGEFRIPLPPALVGKDVDYTLTVNPTNPRLSQAEWEQAVRETAGSCPDFPDVERPGAESYEKRDEF